MAQRVRRLHFITNAKIESQVVSRSPIVLQVLTEKMVRFQGIVARPDARTIKRAEQHLSDSIAGVHARPLQGIRPGCEVSVESKRVLVVVMLAEDLLYAHEPEVEGVL